MKSESNYKSNACRQLWKYTWLVFLSVSNHARILHIDWNCWTLTIVLCLRGLSVCGLMLIREQWFNVLRSSSHVTVKDSQNYYKLTKKKSYYKFSGFLEYQETLLPDIGQSIMCVCVCVTVWRHIASHCQASFPPVHFGEAGSYPIPHERTLRTGSELVPSLGASPGPSSASPLIKGGAQAQA